MENEALSNDFTPVIRSHLEKSIQVMERIIEENAPLISRIAHLFIETFKGGRKAVIFGNGGSAADAQHVAAELVHRFRIDRAALPAIALTTDTSILSSIGNDYGFDRVFARQIEALVTPGDIVVGISTSGNARNVLEGIRVAREKGAVTIGFTGYTGGALRELVDVCFQVPSHNTAHIQEAHITVWHILCDLIEQALFAKS